MISSFLMSDPRSGQLVVAPCTPAVIKVRISSSFLTSKPFAEHSYRYLPHAYLTRYAPPSAYIAYIYKLCYNIKTIPFLQKPLPDNIAAGYVRANRYYPQMDAGLNIGAGAIAASMILGHELRLSDLPRLRATNRQVDSSVAEFEALHNAFRDIPCRMGEKPEAGNPHVVTRQRLRTLASGWVPGFNRTAAQFDRPTPPPHI